MQNYVPHIEREHPDPLRKRLESFNVAVIGIDIASGQFVYARSRIMKVLYHRNEENMKKTRKQLDAFLKLNHEGVIIINDNFEG
jgi:hypothetical protein